MSSHFPKIITETLGNINLLINWVFLANPILITYGYIIVIHTLTIQYMIMTDVFISIPSAFLKDAHCVLDTSGPQWVDMMPDLQKLLNGNQKSRWVP